MNELAAFTYVVEHGGFTAAAEAMQLPKSNISRRIASLEARLGVRLLERTTRKVRVTEIGNIYYQHCRRMLDEADDADLYAEQTIEIPNGTLRVSATINVGQHLLAPITAEFIAQYPEVRLELVWTNRLIDVIDEGFDLTIRVGALQDSSLVARGLGQWSLIPFASAEYLKNRGEPQNPKDLQDHDCLVMSDMQNSNQWTLSAGNITEQVVINPRSSVNDFDTLRRMVADGGGIAVLPSYMHFGDYHNRLVRVLHDWTGPLTELHAIFPSRRGATPKVRAFLDFLSVRLAHRFDDPL